MNEEKIKLGSAWYSSVHNFFFASVKGELKDKNILGYNFVFSVSV